MEDVFQWGTGGDTAAMLTVQTDVCDGNMDVSTACQCNTLWQQLALWCHCGNETASLASMHTNNGNSRNGTTYVD